MRPDEAQEVWEAIWRDMEHTYEQTEEIRAKFVADFAKPITFCCSP
jgi:hypothetical protein